MPAEGCECAMETIPVQIPSFQLRQGPQRRNEDMRLTPLAATCSVLALLGGGAATAHVAYFVAWYALMEIAIRKRSTAARPGGE